MAKRDNSKITTIKLNKETKHRIEKLRSYKRESYDEIIQKLLEILNICKANPDRARIRLIALDRQNRKQKLS
jgi:hypothetical protein